jgi:hypothetical protein
MSTTSGPYYLIIVLVLNLTLVCYTVSTDQIALSQMDDSGLKSLGEPTFGTFHAVGTIASLNFYSNNISDISASKKIILSGDWNLNVNNGSVSFFEADFVAAPAEGNASHNHELVNLVVNDSKPIQLASNGNATIEGTIDVKLNGINYWNDVKTTILISKGSTVTITLDDIDTEHHFMRQPIYGLVDRLAY